MNVLVIGQKGDGPILKRTVTPDEFFEAFGPWAMFLWMHAGNVVEIEGHKVQVVLQ